MISSGLTSRPQPLCPLRTVTTIRTNRLSAGIVKIRSTIPRANSLDTLERQQVAAGQDFVPASLRIRRIYFQRLRKLYRPRGDHSGQLHWFANPLMCLFHEFEIAVSCFCHPALSHSGQTQEYFLRRLVVGKRAYHPQKWRHIDIRIGQIRHRCTIRFPFFHKMRNPKGKRPVRRRTAQNSRKISPSSGKILPLGIGVSGLRRTYSRPISAEVRRYSDERIGSREKGCRLMRQRSFVIAKRPEDRDNAGLCDPFLNHGIGDLFAPTVHRLLPGIRPVSQRSLPEKLSQTCRRSPLEQIVLVPVMAATLTTGRRTEATTPVVPPGLPRLETKCSRRGPDVESFTIVKPSHLLHDAAPATVPGACPSDSGEDSAREPEAKKRCPRGRRRCPASRARQSWAFANVEVVRRARSAEVSQTLNPRCSRGT